MATLVAQGTSSRAVFEAVAEEVAQVMRLPMVAVCRYEDDGEMVAVLAEWSDRPHLFQPGTRWPIDGSSVDARVLQTGRPATIEDYEDLSGTITAGARRSGLNRTAGAPIVVGGSIWGVMRIASPDVPLPEHIEERLARFTELVGTAIANGEARDELTRLADEQAALRRVATLVAAGAQPTEVFEAVSTEVAALIPADGSALTRFEAEETVTAVSGWTADEGYTYVGRRYPLEGTVSGAVFESGRPARVDNYTDAPGEAPEAAREMGWRSSVGAPVTVDGRLWGVLAIASMSDAPLPSDTEQRLAKFTELVASAIANSEAHEELARLADEQAALRRVAMLAAKGAPPVEVFEAVSKEVAGLFRADAGAVMRYETDGTLTAAGGWTASQGHAPTGMRFTLEGSVSGLILETGCPARIDNFDAVPGETAASMRDMGWRTAAGAPISVESRLWGTLVVYSRSAEPFSFGTEERLTTFGEIVATAIANAESRAQLDASRARIVATADATRRRIERDLHDGAQQQLVSLALELRGVEETAPPELRELREGISRSVERMTSVLDELREISHGIHPAILAEGGLGPALKTLARRASMPVNLDVQIEGRLPEPVEVTAYYVVSEALTNAAKYARASVVDVGVQLRRRLLRVRVRDDGRGGADPSRGSGLLGLKDRAEAIGGTLSLHSPHGRGTFLVVELPVEDTTAMVDDGKPVALSGPE